MSGPKPWDDRFAVMLTKDNPDLHSMHRLYFGATTPLGGRSSQEWRGQSTMRPLDERPKSSESALMKTWTETGRPRTTGGRATRGTRKAQGRPRSQPDLQVRH